MALPASAQTGGHVSPLLAPSGGWMTMTEYQGLACGIGGTVAGSAVVAYAVETATAASAASSVVLLPLVAVGFSTGCGVASSLAPALTWLYRHVS